MFNTYKNKGDVPNMQHWIAYDFRDLGTVLRLYETSNLGNR